MRRKKNNWGFQTLIFFQFLHSLCIIISRINRLLKFLQPLVKILKFDNVRTKIKTALQSLITILWYVFNYVCLISIF
jgi:hypothetical protein